MLKSLKSKLVLRLMQTKLYAWLIKYVIPYIRFTTYYTSLRGWKYLKGYKILQSGDIILTVDKKKLTTFLISGDFSHAALCVDKDITWEISEMTHNDYTKSTFFDICKESDRVVLLRCSEWDKEYTKLVINQCKAYSHAIYDISFSLGVKSLYCSELIYHSDFEHRLKVNLDDLIGINRKYISPTGLYQSENVNKYGIVMRKF